MPRKRRAVKGSLKCSLCDRSFSMPAHLGRHMATIHGKAPKGGGMKRKKRRRRMARNGRRAGTVAGLVEMTLEQLSRLIKDARAEARRKIAAFHMAMK